MIVIIAEKAIAGRRIAAILAAKPVPEERTDNAIHFDFKQDGKDYRVIPLRGHIVDVDFPLKYKYWLGTDLRKLVESEIDYKETEKTISGYLKRVAPKAEEAIVATDADREGEAIGLEAIELMRSANPKLGVKRVLFSAIIDSEIKQAFSKLGELDTALAESANSRREIDLIWGAVLTRFLSLVSGRLGKQFLSIGRVQGPTLALIVDREKERMAFKSQKYWLLDAIFEKDKKQFNALHKEGRFWEKEKAEKAFKCRNANQGIVLDVKKTKKLLKRPVPFNTTLFLRAATAIGFTAGRAMQIAETLYQQGLISYPRTDNSVYPEALDLRAILEKLASVNGFSQLASKLLAQKKLEPSAGKLAKDHPPIHPVAAAFPEKLGQQEWKIYELVCRRFMASLAEDALTENLSVSIDLASEIFVATGQRYLRKGWKEFYPYSKATEAILPELHKGDKVNLVKLDMAEKETLPPARYSQGALIKAMSDLNLGTKATRAEIIQKLYSRRYISGLKAIEPNKIAFAVIGALEKYGEVIVKPEMTAALEREMDVIAEGNKKKGKVVEESREILSKALEQLLENKNNVGSLLRSALREDSIIGKCIGKGCTGELLIRRGKTGKRFVGCSAYPKCTVSFPLPQNGAIAILQKRCPECNNYMVQVRGKRYRFEMCIDHNCKSKEAWKKKAAEKPAGKGAEKKPASEESGEMPSGREPAKKPEKKEPGKKPAKKEPALKRKRKGQKPQKK
ncbi:MAG: DNA topoisomerase I [Candidatus Diapherotrites archaeon]|uniref:DNA topoisomerase 1 n=1 Tax=Candidatus Iainarchaeum sp. TaxID=3101447 RepID=A0A939C6V6_9ARCH|nr:DNA topoisomerase I [Candidatus Diapherotrites archaeon]